MEKTVEKEREIQKERETAVAAVKGCEKPEELGPLLWRVIELYAGEPFFTSKQLPFTYTVKGRELFCGGGKNRLQKPRLRGPMKKFRRQRPRAIPSRGRKSFACSVRPISGES